MSSSSDIDSTDTHSAQDVDFQYPETSPSQQQQQQPYNPSLFLFPMKLHHLLEDASKQRFEDVVSWLPDGKSFKVHDKIKFASDIMPKYFGSSKFRSFQKNLNLWIFTTVTYYSPSRNQRGACSHPLFIRDAPHFCHKMKRVLKSKRKKDKQQEGAVRSVESTASCLSQSAPPDTHPSKMNIDEKEEEEYVFAPQPAARLLRTSTRSASTPAAAAAVYNHNCLPARSYGQFMKHIRSDRRTSPTSLLSPDGSATRVPPGVLPFENSILSMMARSSTTTAARQGAWRGSSEQQRILDPARLSSLSLDLHQHEARFGTMAWRESQEQERVTQTEFSFLLGPQSFLARRDSSSSSQQASLAPPTPSSAPSDHQEYRQQSHQEYRQQSPRLGGGPMSFQEKRHSSIFAAEGRLLLQQAEGLLLQAERRRHTEEFSRNVLGLGIVPSQFNDGLGFY
jgi:hypothetical protein